MQQAKHLLIVLAVGGSGGHLFPARHVAADLTSRGCKIAFMGHGLSKSPFFQNHHDLFYDVDSAPIIFRNPLKILKGFFKIMKGTYRSIQILKKLKCQAMVGFGSYHSFPVILAAYLLRIPYSLFEANTCVGRVTRLMGKKALFTSQTILKDEVSHRSFSSIKVKHPRSLERVERKEAVDYYNLDPNKLTMLIFGGSQGAKAINARIIEALALSKVDSKNLQVLHMIGNHESQNEIEKAYKKLNINCCVKTFENQMAYAWSLADLVIARSGASTVLEQLFYHVPAIYIPYPFAADNHQYHNALFVQKQLGAAICFKEEELTSEKLALAIDGHFSYPCDTKQIRERLQAFHGEASLPSLSDVLIEKLYQIGDI